jgi:hypothetical protein
VAREIRTRTTIETESISVIACRQVFRGECERCGREVEVPSAKTGGSLIGTLIGTPIDTLPEALPKRLQPEGAWGRARQGLVMSLKSLLRFLENKGTPPRS